MIPVPTGVKVWLATGHTDMRKGFPGLSLMVQETLKRDPMCGHLFVFRGRGGGLIKVIWHDGQGACLFTKKLERGRFIWPSAADGTVVITPAQLGYLLEGIDWRMPQKVTSMNGLCVMVAQSSTPGTFHIVSPTPSPAIFITASTNLQSWMRP